MLGYRQMLEKDFREIPDLYFDVELLVAEPPYIASRLRFECTPTGQFLDLAVRGAKVSFAEYLDLKIIQVWSIVDKAAIEAQLPPRRDTHST